MSAMDYISSKGVKLYPLASRLYAGKKRTADNREYKVDSGKQTKESR